MGGWLWGARIASTRHVLDDAAARLRPHLAAAVARLRSPNGPPVKMYVHGKAPVRTAVGLYSLILNGYRPSEVLLYGEEQWPPASRAFFADLLPFARVAPQRAVVRELSAFGIPDLVRAAETHWFVMKACVAMLCGPSEFCLMDDDVFILDALDDALDAFRSHDLVFAQDWDHGAAYQESWLPSPGAPRIGDAGRMNAGLYWARAGDRRRMARDTVRVAPDAVVPFVWEQGFIASRFAGGRALGLPTQRYFYPLFDGLPGGVMAYDYRNNPSGFASIHFGGAIDKPTEAGSLALAPEILDRAGVTRTAARGAIDLGAHDLAPSAGDTRGDPYFGAMFELMRRSLVPGGSSSGWG